MSPKKCPGLELRDFGGGVAIFNRGLFLDVSKNTGIPKILYDRFQNIQTVVGNGVSEASTVALLIFGCFQKYGHPKMDGVFFGKPYVFKWMIWGVLPPLFLERVDQLP